MTNQLEHDYHALTNGVGYTLLENHGMIRLTGEDRLKFFHNFCTNEIKKLGKGQACEAFILNSKGKILNFVHAINMHEELFLFGHGKTVQPTVDHLDKFLIREDVVLEDETANWTGLFVSGKKSKDSLLQLTEQLPHKNEFYPVQLQNCEFLLGNVEIAGFGYLILAREPHLTSLLETLNKIGVSKCGLDALEVSRIEHATPWHELDISENNLPQELQRDSKAINFNKGCYLGQETVARIDARGRVNRLLVSIRFPKLSPAEPPPIAGDELTQGGQSIGAISSVTFSFRDQCHVGLGFVKRAFKEPKTQLDQGVIVQ